MIHPCVLCINIIHCLGLAVAATQLGKLFIWNHSDWDMINFCPFYFYLEIAIFILLKWFLTINDNIFFPFRGFFLNGQRTQYFRLIMVLIAIIHIIFIDFKIECKAMALHYWIAFHLQRELIIFQHINHLSQLYSNIISLE